MGKDADVPHGAVTTSFSGRCANNSVTMADVARLAGVAQKTVSRVVNNEPNVSSKVRERVLAAIEQAGYRPNAAARALVTRRTRSLGVVTMSEAFRGPSAIVTGVEWAAREVGYSIMFTRTAGETTSDIGQALDEMISKGVDGLVIVEPGHAGDRLHRNTSGIPVLVFEDRPDEVQDTDWIYVGADDIGAARTAVDHLLSLGHQTVHHVSGPQEWRTGAARAEGWRRTLQEAGRVVPPVLQGDWSVASGYEAGLALAQNPDLTAVFAANDEMAIGVIHALETRGLRVPQDVSVVGMDDIDLAAYLHTPLTTLTQDFAEIARLGISRLIDVVEGREPVSRRVSVPVALNVRATTAAPHKERKLRS